MVRPSRRRQVWETIIVTLTLAAVMALPFFWDMWDIRHMHTLTIFFLWATRIGSLWVIACGLTLITMGCFRRRAHVLAGILTLALGVLLVLPDDRLGPMRITIEPREQGALLQAIQAMRAAEPVRTGLHCSTITDDIIWSWDKQRQRQSDIDMATMLTFQEIGNAVEDILAKGLRDRIPDWEKPTPRTYKGVICSPDGYSKRMRCIDEIKACWKSERGFVLVNVGSGHTTGHDGLVTCTGDLTEESLKFSGYKIRTLFYMSAFDCVRARLHILFVTGTGYPPFPDPVTIRMIPTPDEKQTNEAMILRHARDKGWL